MAKMKNAPNAARVSLYVPADNKFEDLVWWHSFRGLCKLRSTSVFRELIKYIKRDINTNPPTPEEQQFMEEEVRKAGLDPFKKAPSQHPPTTDPSKPKPSSLDDISFG